MPGVARSLLSALLLLLLAGGAVAKDLPRILFLGDHQHRRMVSAAAKELKGKVEIVFPVVQVNDTGVALEKIDELLGEGDWDLIYFNYGLGDLFYRDPKSREIRALSKFSGGVRVTSAEKYRKNLEALVLRLKTTGAPLVWATTTPMVNVNAFPEYQGNLYDAGSEIEYNKIAAKVMKRHGVSVNDVHSYVMAQYGADEKHPGHMGYDKALVRKNAPLHKPVIAAILNALK